jgi:hypothetical protein
MRGQYFVVPVAAVLVWTAMAALAMDASGRSEMDRVIKQWSQPAEWSLTHEGWSGNPYDLIASARFTHDASGQVITTGMYYEPDNTWRFRFTGTKPGTWRFTTVSDVAALNGHEGVVEVTADPQGIGFIVAHGRRWARLHGAEGQLRAFVPQAVMYGSPRDWAGREEMIDADLVEFFERHGFNALHVHVFCAWFDFDRDRSADIDDPDPNPDPRTFAAVEMLIGKAHAAGGAVHIWMWGDEDRTQTPIKWGINGRADLRLQRYLAARLGPLPGWTMGYGFDLWEWVDGPQLEVWRRHMHEHLGWPHLLGARWEKNRLTQATEVMDYASYEQHRPDYDMYVRTIEQRDKPAFSEDRFRVRDVRAHRGKDYTPEMTRRGMWHSMMAGGVANIWGYLLGADRPEGRSGSYPNAAQLQTCSLFFAERFTLDLKRDRAPGGAAMLRSEAGDRLMVYVEDAAAVRVHIPEAAAGMPIVAVDAVAPYREIDLGRAQPGRWQWQPPHVSDWAVAIGRFSEADDARYPAD